MNAIKIETTIDEDAARGLPALRPFIGKHVELIVLETPPSAPRKTKTLDDLVPLKPPPGVGPASLEDIERGTIEGAVKSAGF